MQANRGIIHKGYACVCAKSYVLACFCALIRAVLLVDALVLFKGTAHLDPVKCLFRHLSAVLSF